MVGSDRGDVDRKSALVRGGIFLGDWRYLAGCTHAKSAFRFSRLAIHQLFHLALRNHHRRRFPDVDSPISTIPHVDRASVYLVGVLFCGYSGHDELTDVNYGFLLHKPEAFSILSFLSDSRPLYLVELHGVALLVLPRVVRAICHLRSGKARAIQGRFRQTAPACGAGMAR